MPSGDPKAYINHRREVVTYGLLWHASRVTYEIGQSGVAGSAWQWMASAILTAFSLEAFLNHAGPDLTDWDERAPVRKKLTSIASKLGVDLGAKDERPLSTVFDLIDFRNELAHGRSESLTAVQEEVEPSDVDRLLIDGAPRTAWELKIRSPDFAERARADVESIIVRLHAALPKSEVEPVFFTGMHMSAATLSRTE